MKKISIIILAVLALPACNKRLVFENSSVESSHTISASIDERTRTTYTTEGAFSWVSGDILSYIVTSTEGESPTGYYDRYTYSTTDSGPTATFSGTNPTGEWSSADYAFYPYNGDKANGYDHNTFDVVPKTTSFQGFIYGVIKAYPDRLKGIIPMIGKKTGTSASGKVEDYHFYPVTGILKLSFTGLPSNASQIRLSTPSATSYPLRGTFSIDTERSIPEIKVSDIVAGKGYRDQWLNFAYSSSTDAFYIPVPTGTIPAGNLTISVTNGTSNSFYTVNNKQDIVISRGEITELPIIDIPSVSVKFSGSHSATVFFSGNVKKVKWITDQSNATVLDTSAQTNEVTTTGSTITLGSEYSSNGTRYLAYTAYDENDEVVSSSEALVYYNPSPSTSVVGQYSWNKTATESGKTSSVEQRNTFGNSLNSSPTITLTASDNIHKGNIMITEFAGKKTNKVYGFYKNSTTDLVFNRSNQPIFNESGTRYYLTEFHNTNYIRFRVGTNMSVYSATTAPDLYCQGDRVMLWHDNLNSFDYAIWYFLADR